MEYEECYSQVIVMIPIPSQNLQLLLERAFLLVLFRDSPGAAHFALLRQIKLGKFSMRSSLSTIKNGRTA